MNPNQEEVRLLSSAMGALIGASEHIDVEVAFHCRNESHYHQLLEAVGMSLGFDSLMEQQTRHGRYVRFTPLGTASKVSFPNITVHYYEGASDATHTEG